jgi:hypothetical protein
LPGDPGYIRFAVLVKFNPNTVAATYPGGIVQPPDSVENKKKFPDHISNALRVLGGVGILKLADTLSV